LAENMLVEAAANSEMSRDAAKVIIE